MKLIYSLKVSLLMSSVVALSTALTARGIIGFATDFGLQNEAVGLCKGAMIKINPDLQIIDLTHNIEHYNITEAALVLQRTTEFPKGSVFVCVVDPGVGTKRRGIALQTKAGFTFVGPDNGIFSLVAQKQGIAQVVELEPKKVNPKWQAGTFDGRDLFSPAGAIVASSGQIENVGNFIDASSLVSVQVPTTKWDPVKKELHGQYIRTDEPYGNIWTNITADELTSAGIKLNSLIDIVIGKYTLNVPLAVTFGQVSEGETLGYMNSDGTFALAINMGDFRKSYNVEPGTTLTLKLARE